MKKKRIVTILAACLTFVMIGALSACAGERGPQGEKGEQGIQGVQGEAGKDGITPTIEISDDGYWVINGIKSEYKAVGQDGADGNDGIAPAITISTDGYWVINGIKSEYKAVGKDGINGNDGNDGRGIDSVAYDKDGNLVITYTDNTSDTVILPEREEHVHTYGEWIRYSEEKTSCEKVFYYQVCETCNAVEWRIGSKEDHVWEETYSYDDTYHWISCKNCNQRQHTEKHDLDADGNCTVCKQFIGNVYYEVSADGKYATVIDYDGVASKVYISKEYRGVPVTNIGDSAFIHNQNIKEIILPDTIVTIEDFAFAYSTLRYLTLPDTLITIEDFAFAYSTLEYLTLPDSVKKIGEYAFMDCNNLFEFKISKNVETISRGAFEGADHIQLSVDSNNQYFKYEENVLYSKDGTVLYWYNEVSTAQTSFVIPNTVKIIEQEAFVECKWLKKLTISASVVEIKAGAFSHSSRQRPNEIIFEITEGWICTELEELGGDIYKPAPEDLKTSGAFVIWNHSAYHWKRTEVV